MRALVQRVSRASVTVDGSVVGEIGPGLCALVGVTHTDGADQARALASKIWHLRVFAGENGAMDRPVSEVGGQVLVVSQFTLYGNTRKGRRPSWVDAAGGDHAEPLVHVVATELRALGATVEMGEFGADMSVELVNEGPVTLMLEVDPPPG